MRNVTCKCDTSFDADLPEEIDLDAEAGVLDQILAGTFLEATCPSCGTVLKPELSVRLLSRKRAIDLKVLPEMERLSYHLNEVDSPKGCELLIGYAELYERARILVDGLDPVAIEIIKYYLWIKAEENAPDSADISVAYAGLQEDGGEAKAGKLLFHITGIKEGEIAVLPVSRDYYGKILSDKAKTMKDEPFSRIFKGPYRSIRAIEANAE